MEQKRRVAAESSSLQRPDVQRGVGHFVPETDGADTQRQRLQLNKHDCGFQEDSGVVESEDFRTYLRIDAGYRGLMFALWAQV